MMSRDLVKKIKKNDNKEVMKNMVEARKEKIGELKISELAEFLENCYNKPVEEKEKK